MIEDIFKSAQTQIHERLASPLMGSFVISWCLWNYKFILILLSENSVTTTLNLIKTISYPSLTEILLIGIIYPLLTSAAYIYIYPYPAKYVYEFTRNRQKEINEIKRRIEDETPLTLEESRKIRYSALRAENEFKEEIDRKNEDITRLKEEILALQAPKKVSLKDLLPPQNTPIDSSQLVILRQVEAQKGEAAEKFIVTNSSESKTKTEFDLGELVSKNLLKRDYRSAKNDYIYTFTHDGRKALLEA